MEKTLDGLLPGYRCPNCEAPIPQTVAALHEHPRFTCDVCGITASALLDTHVLDVAARAVNDAAARGAQLRP